MCERKCPKCKSTEHFEQYGLLGTSIFCECGHVFAFKADEEWAPPSEPDPTAWAKRHTWDEDTQSRPCFPNWHRMVCVSSLRWDRKQGRNRPPLHDHIGIDR